MKPQHNIVTALVTVVVLVVIGCGLYFLVHAFDFLVGGLDSEISRLALVGYITLMLSAMIIARGLSRRPSLSDAERVAKEALYERILAAWGEAHRQGGRPAGVEFDEFERLLVLRASKSVINCYLGLQRLELPFDPSDATTRSALQRLLAEIRKDLGQRNVGLETSDVLDLLFNHDRHASNGIDTTLQRIPSAHRLFNGVR